MDTTVQFNYTTFENPIWLATGPLCKNTDDVRKLSKWKTIPTIPYGSGTIEKRPGNHDPNYDYHPILGSINALGMRNPGKDGTAYICRGHTTSQKRPEKSWYSARRATRRKSTPNSWKSQ